MFIPVKENQTEHTGSYYAYTIEGKHTRRPLVSEINVDFCIVGSGLTGLGAALRLAEAGFKVALIERARIGWGASGRNGGQANSGMRLPQDELEKLVGLDDAQKLWQISVDARMHLQDLMRKHAIHCDYEVGLYRVVHKPEQLKASHAYAEHLNAKYGYRDIVPVTKSELEAKLASNVYFGGTYDAGSGHLNPLKLCLGLANAIEAHGGLIYEQTDITEIIEKNDACIIRTPYGKVNAHRVILAGNVLMKGIRKEVDARVMPINSFMLATEPLNEDIAASLISNRAAVVDSKFLVNYFRLSPDNRVLFGGGETYSYRIPTDIKGFVRKYMLKVFPQLVDAKIDFGWSGTIGVTVNRLPFVRKLGTNIFAAAGYSGKGVLLAPYFGKILADAVMGDSRELNTLERLPSMKFPGGNLLRWPLLVAGMSYYALRDKL